MTFEILAKLVADDFRNTMEEEGFETFQEMKKCYMWDAQDIRDEIVYIVTELSNEYWENHRESFSISDDGSFLEIGISKDMDYKEFKALVFSNLK